MGFYSLFSILSFLDSSHFSESFYVLYTMLGLFLPESMVCFLFIWIVIVKKCQNHVIWSGASHVILLHFLNF